MESSATNNGTPHFQRFLIAWYRSEGSCVCCSLDSDTQEKLCLRVDKIQNDLQEVGDSFCWTVTSNKKDNRFIYKRTKNNLTCTWSYLSNSCPFLIVIYPVFCCNSPICVKFTRPHEPIFWCQVCVMVGKDLLADNILFSHVGWIVFYCDFTFNLHKN